MKITKRIIQTALKSLLDAGENGVHSFKLQITTQYKYPNRIIEHLKKDGYIFKTQNMVQMGKVGVVYVLLEHHPRKQLAWQSEKNPDGQWNAKLIVVDNSPKQEGLFT